MIKAPKHFVGGKAAYIRLSSHFPALHNKTFRLFWLSQAISLLGTWIQTTALSWLVYTLSGSAFLSGISVAVSAVPLLVLSPFSGIIIDRYSEKKALIITQTTLSVISLTAAVLVFIGAIDYWHILLFNFISGAANAVINPARQTLICHLVGKDDFMNGIALNSAAFNASRMIGPAVAGILMDTAGIHICFLINSLCFLPIIWFMLRLKLPFTKSDHSSVINDMKEALQYSGQNLLLKKTLMISTVVGMLAMNYSVLTPVLVSDVLQSSGTGYGILLSFMGVGSLLAAIILAAHNKISHGLKALKAFPACLSILFFLLGICGHAGFIQFLYVLYGFCVTSFATLSNSTVMIYSDTAMRGRILGIYTLLFTGMNPIGGILAGFLAEQYGISAAHWILGTIIIFFTVLIFKEWRKQR